MEGRISQNSSRPSRGVDARCEAFASVGKVIVFPGHKPSDEQLRYVLGILANAGPISVRHLKMGADLPEALLIKCVERLTDSGLLTAEDRRDGNALRLIVSASDAGRRLLAAGVEDDKFSRGSFERGEVG